MIVDALLSDRAGLSRASFRRTVRCVALWGIALISSAQGVDAGLIEEHARHMTAVFSLHLKWESHSCLSEAADAPVVLDAEYEVWQQGVDRRIVQRTHWMQRIDGTASEVSPPDGRVYDSSINGLIGRSMDGWDPLRPPVTPLDYSRRNAEFAGIKCSINSVDPEHASVFEERTALLWELRSGWPLSRLASESVLEQLPGDGEITRMRLISSRSPEWAELAGALIDLDGAHGFQISRVEIPYGEQSVVTSVLRFEKFGDGPRAVWIAMETESFLGERLVGRNRVTSCSVNLPIDPQLLQTAFPEGALVQDVSTGTPKFHIWGQGAPAETTESQAAALEVLYARARNSQSQEGTAPVVDAEDPAGVPMWIIINLVCVGLLVVLTVIRRQMTPPDESTSKSA